MQTYHDGWDFQRAIFGPSLGRDLLERFRGTTRPDFSREIRKIIRSAEWVHPPTEIGASLHREVSKQLEYYGIKSEGLVFLSTLDSSVDFFHGTDGFFFLPSLDTHLVTVDAYLVNTEFIYARREEWIDSFPETFYSEANFQSDLFLSKTGHSEWIKLQERKRQEARGENCTAEVKIKDLFSRSAEIDFRKFAVRGREENHFILTPYYTGTIKKQRQFAKIVASYFAKVANVTGHEALVQLSP